MFYCVAYILVIFIEDAYTRGNFAARPLQIFPEKQILKKTAKIRKQIAKINFLKLLFIVRTEYEIEFYFLFYLYLIHFKR